MYGAAEPRLFAAPQRCNRAPNPVIPSEANDSQRESLAQSRNLLFACSAKTASKKQVPRLRSG
jgi:hypothetical protein